MLVHIPGGTCRDVRARAAEGRGLQIGTDHFRIGVPTTLGDRMHGMPSGDNAAERLHRAAIERRHDPRGPEDGGDEFTLVASTHAVDGQKRRAGEHNLGQVLPSRRATWTGMQDLMEASYSHPTARATLRLLYDSYTLDIHFVCPLLTLYLHNLGHVYKQPINAP